jgi:hypothetical protein
MVKIMTPRAYVKGTMTAGVLLLALAMAAPVGAEPGAPSNGTPPAQALQLGRQGVGYRSGRPASEARLRFLAKGLKLDAAQQAAVRRALLAQREALHRLSSGPPDPGVSKVAAIQAINRRTADRIRAVLNDEQRKLYAQPLPQDYVPGEGKPGVAEWLTAMQRKGG